MAFFRKKTATTPRPPWNVQNFILAVVVGLVLVNIFLRVAGVWNTKFLEAATQMTLGALYLIIIAGAALALAVTKRLFFSQSDVRLSKSDFVFIILAFGIIVFLMIYVPKLFNIPGIFSVAYNQLQSTIIP